MDDARPRGGLRNVFGVIAGALFVVGPALAGLRLVPGIVGFGLFALGGIGGLVVGAVSVVQAARARGLGRGGAVAVGVGVVFLALALRSAGAPRINDFTTDPANPPAFTHAATLPRNVDHEDLYSAGVRSRTCRTVIFRGARRLSVNCRHKRTTVTSQNSI